MSNRISEYFSNHAKKREEKKVFKANMAALAGAIREGDDQKFSTVLADVKVSPLFTLGADETLLREAIRKDNEPVFAVLLSMLKSPDHCFNSHSGGGPDPGVTFSRKEHILHAAINAGSEAIALSLAKNKAVSIDQSGYSETTYYGKEVRKEVTHFDPPLDLAEKKGMHQVAAVLAERTSKEYAVRAQQAKAKAAQPTGP